MAYFITNDDGTQTLHESPNVKVYMKLEDPDTTYKFFVECIEKAREEAYQDVITYLTNYVDIKKSSSIDDIKKEKFSRAFIALCNSDLQIVQEIILTFPSDALDCIRDVVDNTLYKLDKETLYKILKVREEKDKLTNDLNMNNTITKKIKL